MAEPEVVRIPLWQEIEWLRHGFSRRSGGVSTVYGETSLNLGWTKEDDPDNVRENRRLLVDRVGPSMKLVTVRQVHGNTVQVLCGEDARQGRLETPEGKAVLEGDGLVSNDPGVLLGVGSADCVPVLVIDRTRRAVGAFHAGWRGTVSRIVERGIDVMRSTYGSRPEDLQAAVGPSIGSCCYTVGEEVRQQFAEEFSYGTDLFHTDQLKDGSIQMKIDLWEANRRQLLSAGLTPANIVVVGECTGCATGLDGRRSYFSHRMDSGVAGRMLNVIGISGS
jgi:hypothetical protein